MENKKICLECGEVLFGRADKKFCSDACRNTYNNKQNSDVNHTVRKINMILKKNRRILSELNPQADKARVHKDKMLQMGYNFKYHTHQYTTKTGNNYTFCYDQGFFPMGEDFYFLVVRDDTSR